MRCHKGLEGDKKIILLERIDQWTDHCLHCITPIVYKDKIIGRPMVVAITEDEH